MSDIKTAAAALLERLRYRGLHLSVTAEGNLQVWPADWLDEATSDAIRLHKPELLALLSASTKSPAVDVLEDDRHRCRDCYHLQRMGNCAMAAQGRLPGVPEWYTPHKDMLQRCHRFCALPY
ncbi:hypothetical protein [Acidovorax sp. Q11]